MSSNSILPGNADLSMALMLFSGRRPFGIKQYNSVSALMLHKHCLLSLKLRSNDNDSGQRVFHEDALDKGTLPTLFLKEQYV